MVSYDIALSGGDELACVDVVYSAGGLMTSCATVLVVVGTGVLIGEGLIGAGLKANLSPTIRGWGLQTFIATLTYKKKWNR